MEAPPLLNRLSDWAVFTDIDGTLLEIAATPQQVAVQSDLVTLLQDLQNRLDGALAVVSGRTMEHIDTLFAPLRLPCAGLHGLLRRDFSGRLSAAAGDFHGLSLARDMLVRFVQSHPGTLLEDKNVTLALHYRQSPESESLVRAVAAEALPMLGKGWHIQEGKKVIELKPRSATKATAMADFMQEAPFAGRRPVFIGDDLTDEAGFVWAESVKGCSVHVGGTDESYATHARWRLPNVAAVHAWLRANLT